MSLFGGSKSKSSSSSATTGSQTQLGDAVSINVGGGKKSHTNINVEKVDFGSVSRSFEFATDALYLSHLGQDSVLNFAEKTTDTLLSDIRSFGGDILSASRGVSGNILSKSYTAGDRLLGASRGVSGDILSKSYTAGDRLLDSAESEAKRIGSFAMDTLDNAFAFSSDIIAAGQNNAGIVERLSETFQNFVDEQNNPNEKNQMLLIVGAVGVLAVVVFMAGKK